MNENAQLSGVPAKPNAESEMIPNDIADDPEH